MKINKNIKYLIFLVVILLFSVSAFAQKSSDQAKILNTGNPDKKTLDAGGPDNYGYRWIDNSETGGPAYEWIELSTDPEAIAIYGSEYWGGYGDSYHGGNNGIPIGFDFNYYGTNYNRFWISNKGYIGFGPPVSYNNYNPSAFPDNNAPNNIIALLWDDMMYAEGYTSALANFKNTYMDKNKSLAISPYSSEIYFKTFPDYLVVQYYNFSEYYASGRMDAELIIYKNGQIKFQYKRFQNWGTGGGFALNKKNMQSSSLLGSTVSIGIENSNGSDGLNIQYGPHPSAGTAILITPYSVTAQKLVDFGNVGVNSSSIKTVEITNNTMESITIKDFELYDRDAAMFSLPLGTDPIIIPAHSTYLLPVQFMPTDLGSRTAGLYFYSPEVEQYFEVQIFGWGASAANQISFTPNFLLFGNLNLNETKELSFSLNNISSNPITITNIQTIGTDAGLFTRISNPDSTGIPITLPAGRSYTFRVKFLAQKVGTCVSNLDVTYNTGAENMSGSVAMLGVGQGPKIITPIGPLVFGNTKLGMKNSLSFSITNGGQKPLTISSIYFSGNDAGMFKLAPGTILKKGNKNINSINSFPKDIAAGQTIFITMEFEPTIAGNRFTNIVINHNDITSPNPTNIAVQGFAAPTFATMRINGNINFGNLYLLTVPKDTIITISASSPILNDNLILNRTTFNAETNIFEVLDRMPISITPGTFYNLRVRMNPIQAGTFSNVLTVQNSSINNPNATVTLNGTVTATHLQVTPGTMDYGNTSRTRPEVLGTFVIKNIGTTNITLNSKTITGDNLSFTFTRNAANITLQPNEVDSVIIKFAPQSIGPKSAQFVIASNDNLGNILYVNLSGFGGDSPIISADKNIIDYKDVLRNVEVDSVVTLTNIGNILLNLNNIGIEGDDKAFYSIISGGTPTSLKYGEKNIVKVRFKGNLPIGVKNAYLRVVSNSSENSNLIINLTGNIQGQALYREYQAVIFDTTEVGFSRDTIVKISNTGNLPLTISKIYLDGPFMLDFSFKVDPETFTLAPGEEKSISITFKPSAVGVRYARLLINSNDPVGGEQAIILRGTGKIIPRPEFVLNIDTLRFGNVMLGSTVDLTLIIKNIGSAEGEIPKISFIGPDNKFFSIFGLNFPVKIQPGQSLQVTIRFNPVKDLSKGINLSLQILTNDPKKPVLIVPITAFISSLGLFNVYIPDTIVNRDTIEIPVYLAHDITNKNILSYQFSIDYDKTKVDAVNTLILTGSVTSAAGWTTNQKSNPGQITIGAYGSAPLSGFGKLITLKFIVVAPRTIKHETMLSFSNFQFNNGNPGVITADGKLTINPTSSQNIICGDADANNSVNALDAAATLRHAVRIESLTKQGQLNADVDKNGVTNAFDASLILRHVINLPMPSSVTTTCWGSAIAKSSSSVTSAVLNASIKNNSLANENSYSVKFSGFSNNSDVYSISFDIDDENSIVKNVFLQGLSKDYLYIVNKLSGSYYKVAIINPNGIDTKDIILNINLKEKVNCDLTLKNIEINNYSQGDLKIYSSVNSLSVENYDLIGAYPNPFNPSTNIVYQVSENSQISIEIYDIKGSRIRTLLKREVEKGKYEISWDGRNDENIIVSAGIYYCRMNAKNYSKTINLQLIK